MITYRWLSVQVASARTVNYQASPQRLDMNELLKRAHDILFVSDVLDAKTYAMSFVEILQYTAQHFRAL